MFVYYNEGEIGTKPYDSAISVTFDAVIVATKSVVNSKEILTKRGLTVLQIATKR